MAFETAIDITDLPLDDIALVSDSYVSSSAGGFSDAFDLWGGSDFLDYATDSYVRQGGGAYTEAIDIGDGPDWVTLSPESHASDLDDIPKTYTATATVCIQCLPVEDDDSAIEIVLGDLLNVDFYHYPQRGNASLKVDFTDRSNPTSCLGKKSTIIKWLWLFGDGFYSTRQHPSHTYVRPGRYRVTLQIWVENGNTGATVRYVTVEDPLALIRVSKTLRMAFNRSQGIGWAECSGDDWISPKPYGGVLPIIDAYGHKRMLIEDESDDKTWEESTFDRVTYQGPAWKDKDDLASGGSEIALEKWEKELWYRNLPMEHMRSKYRTVPQRPGNKGDTGYDANGYRTSQQFDIDAYVDGDLQTPFGSVYEIPEDGEIHFGGLKVSGRRHMFVFKCAASEVRITEAEHTMLIKSKVGTRTQRTMQSNTHALLLSQPVYRLSRHITPLYELVRQSAISGNVTAITGPDGRSRSAITINAIMNLSNSAVSGAYTVIYWRKDTGDIATIPGLGGMTQYGDTFSNWQMWYKTGTGLPANLVINKGSVFDIAIYDADVTDALLNLYNDIRYNAGRVYLPLF